MVIEELSGELRRLELRGPGLPFKGASWKGTQTVITTYYPGAQEASQQVLGPKEEPSEWEGEWNRTRLGKTPCTFRDAAGTEVKVVSPSFLSDAMDSFRILGTKLRVTWSASDSDGTPRASKVREGRLDEFEVIVDTGYDIRWKARFAWSSRGGTQAKVVATREGDLDAASRGLASSANDMVGFAQTSSLVASRAALPKSASTLTLGKLEQLAKVPVALVNAVLQPIKKANSDLQQLANIASTVRAIPFEVAAAAAAVAASTLGTANRFRDQMSRRPAEASALRTEVSAVTRAWAYFAGTEDKAAAVAADAHALKNRLASAGRNPNQVTPRKTISVHITKAGETLATISALYYGTPDRAIDIARANRLPWHQRSLNLGRTLIVPVLDASQQARS